jgi:hypothetical protein
MCSMYHLTHKITASTLDQLPTAKHDAYTTPFSAVIYASISGILHALTKCCFTFAEKQFLTNELPVEQLI